MVTGEVGGERFEGVVVGEFENGNVHVEVHSTEISEWVRDMERGYPVIISIKKDKLSRVVR